MKSNTIGRIGLVALVCFLFVGNIFRGLIQFIHLTEEAGDKQQQLKGSSSGIGFEIPHYIPHHRQQQQQHQQQHVNIHNDRSLNEEEKRNHDGTDTLPKPNDDDVVVDVDTTTTTVTTTTTTSHHKIKRQAITLSKNDRNRRNDTDILVKKIPRPPTFLLGIMSHDLPGTKALEQDMRNAVRDTYLAYYKDIDRSTPNRICKLTTILQSDNPAGEFDECQLAYAIVIGGGNNETQPTELLNVTSSHSMILSHPEDDVINLNIKENGKFGKSPTWFRYATLIRKEYDLPIDYIIKTDSDTLFSPSMFFKWVEEQEVEYFFPVANFTDVDTTDHDVGQSDQSNLEIDNATSNNNKSSFRRERIFGGSPFDRKMCGWPSHEHCENFTAPVYMGGAFYFLSSDLADYISSDRCPRKKIFIPHEDVTNGNYVFSHPDLITTFENPKGYVRMWRHPLKRPKGVYSKYIQFLAEEGIEGISEMLAIKKQSRKRDETSKRRQEAREILMQRAANNELAPPLVLSLDNLRRNAKLRNNGGNIRVQPKLST